MSDSKRIAILGPAHPYRGGIAAFNENLALELVSKGHDVELINFKFQYPDWIYPGENQLSSSPAPEKLVIKRMIHSLNPLNWIYVRHQLKKANYHIVFCPYWLPLLSPCFSSVIKGLNKNTRVVGLLHNIIPHESRKGDKVLTSMFLDKLSEGVVLSDSVKRDLESFELSKRLTIRHLFHPVYDHYGERIDKIEALKELSQNTDRTYLLFFGIVRKYKGLDILIKAFGEAKLPDHIDLIIAGEFYDSKEEYIDLIEKSGKVDRIHLFDQYIPDDQIRYFFSAADLLVLPYRTATQSGVSQIAIHFGLPIVSTNVGGISEYVRDGLNGKLMESSDELVKVLEGNLEEESIEIWRKGQEEMRKKLSWSKFSEALEI